MADKSNAEAPELRRGPRCRMCADYPNRLIYSFLDPLTGKTVRLYQCQCGERIWDE